MINHSTVLDYHVTKFNLYTRYPTVARALGLAKCAREQRNLAYKNLTRSQDGSDRQFKNLYSDPNTNQKFNPYHNPNLNPNEKIDQLP